MVDSVARGSSMRAAASGYKVGYQALRRHILGKHPGTEVLDPDADAAEADEKVQMKGLASVDSAREKLQVVIDALEERLGSGRARSDEIREYRIALKDLHEMQQSEEGPRAVTMDEVEGLPELLVILASVLEPYPQVRKALMAELERAGLGHVLG
jgi:hypothetical protein